MESSSGQAIPVTTAISNIESSWNLLSISPSQPIHPHARVASSSISTFRRHLLTYPGIGELSPYADWQVVLFKEKPGQLVLWNPDSKQMVVKRLQGPAAHERRRRASRSHSHDAGLPDFSSMCPHCGQPMPVSAFGMDDIHSDPPSSSPSHEPGSFTTADYFQILETTTNAETVETVVGNDISSHWMNQGYYERFFVETRKLGRGQRGSVFLVQHILDGVYLGDYAVKSIPVGVSHSWLVKQLQEVHLLERLRHSNIINYKHAWIEKKQLSVFGPEVPCLFILMELANGGSLDEYIQIQTPNDIPELSGLPPRERIRALKAHRESLKKAQMKKSALHRAYEGAKRFGGIGVNEDDGKRVRYLTSQQIWSLFMDVLDGLAHLHTNGIMHRDLKPQNLLLHFDNPDDTTEIPKVLISDFGECEVVGESTDPNRRSGGTGTLEFMSPELLERDEAGNYTGSHSLKGDMFSLGVVLFYLCYSRIPYSQVDDVDLLREEILSFQGVEFPDDHEERVPGELKSLISKLLSRDPNDRPSTQDILKMGFRRQARRLSAIKESDLSFQRGLSFHGSTGHEDNETSIRDQIVNLQPESLASQTGALVPIRRTR